MDQDLHLQIQILRAKQFICAQIAGETGLPVNTVKSYLRRHPVETQSVCLQCGKPVMQTPHRKEKKALLGPVPPALVERSSGAHHAQSRSDKNVPVQRRGIRCASERKTEILQPQMLQSRPKTGCVMSTNISPLCRNSLSGIAG